jgi:SAM-dependent methyltransferase
VGARDRSIGFVFDTVVDSYVSGRPEMPVDAVREATSAVGVQPGSRVLEVGAGTGQLTHALLELGFDVVALEPGDALRARAAVRAPGATFVASTFEAFEADGWFEAVVSSNAFHWVDPEVGYAKAAELAGAIVLIWDTAFVADAELRRRIQCDVMNLHGSTFPVEEEDVRQFVADELVWHSDELRQSGRFDEPWTNVIERRLVYTPERYLDLIGSMGHVVALGEREAIMSELRPVLGTELFELVDLVWTIAARAARSAAGQSPPARERRAL